MIDMIGPGDLGNSHLDWIADCENQELLIDQALDERTKKIIYTFKTLVHPDLLQYFIETLSYGYLDECTCAEKIAHKYNLDKLDFLAIVGSRKQFSEEMRQEQESFYED